MASNFQLKMDRMFLEACQGIVDGNMSSLQRFLNAGGELTRALTSEEIKLLNNIQAANNQHLTQFSVGHTLIHLCCQYKQKDFLIRILNESSNKKAAYQSSHCMPTNSFSNTIMNNINNNNNNGYNSRGKSKVIIKAKYPPCQSCPHLAANIVDRYFSANLRQRKTNNATSTTTADQYGACGGAGSCLGGATNSLGNTSPSSSLISLNNSNNQAFIMFNKNASSFHHRPSPSPSPPPASSSLGATYSSPSFCYYVNECHTFSLPNEIEDFAPHIQRVLFDELLDRDVERELEFDANIINWSGDSCKRLHSRLYPLWNRHSGDCLLDSVLQACYGVFDSDNTLRRVMAESLEQYSSLFKPRWKDHELLLAQSLDYTLDDNQLEQDWNNVLALANQPGASLEQAHIFALCHIFRRPIIIYSVKYVKSFRGENIGFTHFEGVYLPLNWEPSFCYKSPIALGYTRGHFTALVPLERNEINFTMNKSNGGGSANSSSMDAGGAIAHQFDNEQQQTFYLPLTNSDGQLLPVHFLNCSEIGRERTILRQYLQVDCLVTQTNGFGLYVAQQRVGKLNKTIHSFCIS
mgnify:CR=1 FL=1